MVRLETDRLIMRMFRADDLDEYAAIVGDPEVAKFLGGEAMTREEAWRHMAMMLGHWELRGHGFWALEERETGALVGRAGCIRPEGWPGFEVAWTLGRAHWGKGYATEAGRAAMRWAFEERGERQVISLIHPENARSMRVAERLGETYERDTIVRGITVRVYGIDRAGFAADPAG